MVCLNRYPFIRGNISLSQTFGNVQLPNLPLYDVITWLDCSWKDSITSFVGDKFRLRWSPAYAGGCLSIVNERSRICQYGDGCTFWRTNIHRTMSGLVSIDTVFHLQIWVDGSWDAHWGILMGPSSETVGPLPQNNGSGTHTPPPKKTTLSGKTSFHFVKISIHHWIPCKLNLSGKKTFSWHQGWSFQTGFTVHRFRYQEEASTWRQFAAAYWDYGDFTEFLSICRPVCILKNKYNI